MGTSNVRLLLMVQAGLIWSLGSCGGSSPTGGVGGEEPGDGGNGDANGSGAVPTTQVAVRDDFFSPEDIVVAPNATVVWTWLGTDFHDVAWVSAPLDDSPLQDNGIHEVTMPGATDAYHYYCTIHGSPTSGMRGSVLVQQP